MIDPKSDNQNIKFRDQCALFAMHGILMSAVKDLRLNKDDVIGFKTIAEAAYLQADAMLAVRENYEGD